MSRLRVQMSSIHDINGGMCQVELTGQSRARPDRLRPQSLSIWDKLIERGSDLFVREAAMRPIFICIAIATFAWWQLPSELAAQTKNIVRPDFSGVWKMDRTRS